MTKSHEEFLHGTLSEIIDTLSQRSVVKGEFVVSILPADNPETLVSEDVVDLLVWHRDKTDLSMKDAVKKITRDLNLPRNDVYKQALAVWQKK